MQRMEGKVVDKLVSASADEEPTTSEKPKTASGNHANCQ